MPIPILQCHSIFILDWCHNATVKTNVQCITSMDMFASDIVNNFYYFSFTVTKKTQGLFALLSKI